MPVRYCAFLQTYQTNEDNIMVSEDDNGNAFEHFFNEDHRKVRSANTTRKLSMHALSNCMR